jgi:hypothetical protein
MAEKEYASSEEYLKLQIGTRTDTRPSPSTHTTDPHLSSQSSVCALYLPATPPSCVSICSVVLVKQAIRVAVNRAAVYGHSP